MLSYLGSEGGYIMKATQKQKMYANQLRSLYGQIHDKKSSVDSKPVELSALNMPTEDNIMDIILGPKKSKAGKQDRVQVVEDTVETYLGQKRKLDSDDMEKIIEDAVESYESQEQKLETDDMERIIEDTVRSCQGDYYEDYKIDAYESSTETEVETKVEADTDTDTEEETFIASTMPEVKAVQWEKVSEDVEPVFHKIETPKIKPVEWVQVPKEDIEKALRNIGELEETKESEVSTVGIMAEERSAELQDVLSAKQEELAASTSMDNQAKSFKEIMEEKWQAVKMEKTQANIESLHNSRFHKLFDKTRTMVHTMKDSISNGFSELNLGEKFNKARTNCFNTLKKAYSATKNATSSVLEKLSNTKKGFQVSTRTKAAIAAGLVSVVGLATAYNMNSKGEEVSPQNASISQDLDDTDMKQEFSVFEGLANIDLEEVISEIGAKNTPVYSSVEPVVVENSDYVNDEERILLGKTILLNENVPVYMSEQDAYLEENALSSYYSSADERVVIGALVSNGESMMRISASQENANATLNDILNNGGEVVSVLTANRNYSLSDYDGSHALSSEQLGASVEGWYNINAIRQESVKTLCK